MKDEYDVQDLFHSLLTLYFNDIRPEEGNPSVGGKSTRSDFLLQDIETIIEIKMTRDGLDNKKVSQQIIEDKAHYKINPKCKKIYFMIYDPENKINNPRGFEKDLSESTTDYSCKVIVVP